MELGKIKLDRILDTTLREGEQTPRVYFSPEEKCVIAEMLFETIGEKAYLEIGQPYSPKYREGVEAVVKHFKEKGLNARLLSHCRTLRQDVDIAESCGTWGVVVYFAPSEKHLLYKFKGMSFEKALNQIADVIDYAKNKIGFECVEYTLEDATSVPFDRMIEVCKTAERAGVDVLRIPDTKGQIEFDDFREMIEKLVKNVDTPIDVHCHNDRGLAVANAIAGLKAGATGVHVSVLGLGERCGITDLVTLVETLESVHHVNTGVNFKKIPSLYDYVSAVSGIAIPPSFPIVGVFARTHKAGTHQKAVLHCPDTYETIDWAKYGLEREYEFGAMQARELTEKLLEGVEVGAEVKEEIDRRIREVSMERGRPLSRAEVWRIAESVGVKLELSYKASFPQDAKIFIKVRPGCDELNLIKNVMKKFLEYKIPAKISVMVGEYDMLVDVRGIKSPQDLDSITREIRRENKDIMETSTSIVLDKYE